MRVTLVAKRRSTSPGRFMSRPHHRGGGLGRPTCLEPGGELRPELGDDVGGGDAQFRVPSGGQVGLDKEQGHGVAPGDSSNEATKARTDAKW